MTHLKKGNVQLHFVILWSKNHCKPLEKTVKEPISWQRFGNGESDGPCFCGNGKIINIVCQIALANPIRKGLLGAVCSYRGLQDHRECP